MYPGCSHATAPRKGSKEDSTDAVLGHFRRGMGLDLTCTDCSMHSRHEQDTECMEEGRECAVQG